MPQTRASSIFVTDPFDLRTITGPFQQCAVSCPGTFLSTTQPGNFYNRILCVCVITSSTRAAVFSSPEAVLVKAFQIATQGTWTSSQMQDFLSLDFCKWHGPLAQYLPFWGSRVSHQDNQKNYYYYTAINSFFNITLQITLSFVLSFISLPSTIRDR